MKELEAVTPPSLDRTVRRCLEKDPEERWQSARDVGSQLRWIGERTGESNVRPDVGLGRLARVIPILVFLLIGVLSGIVRRVQTGYLYHYAFAMLIGVAALVTWMMLRGSL